MPNTDNNFACTTPHFFTLNLGIRGGVVIESGGFDGVTFSVSYMFEKFADWTSILVEADLQNFENMLKNRKEAININCALCNSTSTLHYTQGGTVAGILEFMAPGFLATWHASLDRGENKDKLRAELKTVQCIKMASLLSTIGVTRVDLWILDVEGAEEVVLHSVDWESVQISAIMMECDNHGIERNLRSMAYLAEKKYTCIKPKNDCLCLHETFTPSSRGTLRKRPREKETGKSHRAGHHGRGHMRNSVATGGLPAGGEGGLN